MEYKNITSGCIGFAKLSLVFSKSRQNQRQFCKPLSQALAQQCRPRGMVVKYHSKKSIGSVTSQVIGKRRRKNVRKISRVRLDIGIISSLTLTAPHKKYFENGKL